MSFSVGYRGSDLTWDPLTWTSWDYFRPFSRFFKRYPAQTGILVNFKHHRVDRPVFIPIGGECVLNSARGSNKAARHPSVANVSVRFWTAHVEPTIEPVLYSTALWKDHLRDGRRQVHMDFSWFTTGFPLAKDAQINETADWWNDFYYAMVKPRVRKHSPNFEDRIRNSTLTVLPCSDLVAYFSPGHGQESN